MEKFDISKLKWTYEPKEYDIKEGRIEITTEPFTDLWQRTYYHFRNDNAPMLQMKTKEKYFSFVVKAQMEVKERFDQCGIVMYLDSENWLKASIENENADFSYLGSVVTNHGYSDYGCKMVDFSVRTMWFRLSRREDDFCIESSEDGVTYYKMRVCHMFEAKDEISFGLYACSPENSSVKAIFTEMEVTECKWEAHDGQAPDEDYEP